MKAVILAGGFARRLGKIAEGRPKVLLPVAGRPILEHVLGRVEEVKDVDVVYMTTNSRFESQFLEFLQGFKGKYNKKLRLFTEPAMEEGQKLGSIGALQFFIEKSNMDEELLVINGDNLFEFDLNDFLDFYRKKKTFVFAVYDTGSLVEARKLGVVLLDKNGRVVDFEEKPESPKSTQISTGIYVFPRDALRLIKQYVDEGKNPDRVGDFLIWLMKRQRLHAFVFRGRWFDIGSPESYEEAQREFK